MFGKKSFGPMKCDGGAQFDPIRVWLRNKARVIIGAPLDGVVVVLPSRYGV